MPHPSDPERFLCQQRLPGGPRGDLWEFPGGKVEPGEAEEAALERELREELDVPVSVGARLWEGTHAYPDLEVELVLYAARLLGGTPRAVTAQELAWCTFEEMQARPFCEADVPLIAGLVDGSVRTA
ncbi:MAG TPA: NUDIX domain-containing protein [Myxococcaceae bacterium]|nr:NUDIX domain-containing protein [Myxococcaceae bacterium]